MSAIVDEPSSSPDLDQGTSLSAAVHGHDAAEILRMLEAGAPLPPGDYQISEPIRIERSVSPTREALLRLKVEMVAELNAAEEAKRTIMRRIRAIETLLEP